MTFWHNQKYEKLEKSTLNGDFMRGIPAKKFPWLLKNQSLADKDGDVWQIQVLCLNIEAKEISQKVKSQISLQASCFISKESLKKMNLEFQRLFDLDFQGWNSMSEKCPLNVVCLMDKLEEKCTEFYKVFFNKIQAKYTLEKKKEIILSNIKNCTISNFS